MAFVLMRDQSLEYVLMTSNALIRSGKGNRGDKESRSVLKRNTGSFLAGWTENRPGGTLRWCCPSWRAGSITMSDRGKWLVVGLAVGLWLAIGVGLAIRAL
jgi:hypothetical protein